MRRTLAVWLVWCAACVGSLRLEGRVDVELVEEVGHVEVIEVHQAELPLPVEVQQPRAWSDGRA